MEKTQIKILDGSLCHSIPYFSYLIDCEKHEIEKRIKENYSILVGFYQKEKLEFVAVIDFLTDGLHVREVAGNFLRKTYFLDVFTTALAKKYNKDRITICTSKRAVEKHIMKIGFENKIDYFERKVA